MNTIDMMSGVIEDAPTELDLATLLGVSGEDLDAGSNEVVILNEDNIVVEEPHIKIPTKKLEDVLKISAILASSGMGSMDSKNVCMMIEQGKVRFLLTDAFMTNVEKEVELINTDNQFEGTLVFSTEVLARVSKVCTSIFTLVERTSDTGVKKYYLKIMGGEISLDNINNVNIGIYEKKLQNVSYTDFNKDELTDNLKRLFNYVNSAIKDSRIINFSGNVVQASPQGSAVRCTLSSVYPNFGMKVHMAKLIYLLASGDVEKSIKFNGAGNVVKGSDYSIIVSNVNSNVCAYDSVIDRMFVGESCVVDVQHLIKLTDLSCGLNYSVGSLIFNYTASGMVSCELVTKRGNSVIELRGTSNSSVMALETAVEISSITLKNALTVFPQESIVNLRISSDGISMEAGKVKAVVLGKGMGK